MGIFLMFGKSSSEELKEINLKYTAEVLSLIKKFGGNVKSMHVMLKERDLVFILTFPGIAKAVNASIALSKLTGISFTASPAVTVEEFAKIMI